MDCDTAFDRLLPQDFTDPVQIPVQSGKSSVHGTESSAFDLDNGAAFPVGSPNSSV